jgi:hypothetical protein
MLAEYIIIKQNLCPFFWTEVKKLKLPIYGAETLLSFWLPTKKIPLAGSEICHRNQGDVRWQVINN